MYLRDETASHKRGYNPDEVQEQINKAAEVPHRLCPTTQRETDEQESPSGWRPQIILSERDHKELPVLHVSEWLKEVITEA